MHDTSCIYVTPRDGQKRYMQIAGYVTGMEGIKKNYGLNLMAGAWRAEKQKSEISTNLACMLDLILYFLIWIYKMIIKTGSTDHNHLGAP